MVWTVETRALPPEELAVGVEDLGDDAPVVVVAVAVTAVEDAVELDSEALIVVVVVVVARVEEAVETIWTPEVPAC